MDPLSAAASVAGVVTIAAQLAISVDKIKAFCAEVKDAPANVKTLINQLHHLVMVMQHLEDGTSPAIPQSPVVANSLDICRDAVGDIATLTSELEVEMTRHRRAAFKMVLKRSKLENMLVRLEQSKTSLHLAFSVYSDARMRHDMSIIQQTLTASPSCEPHSLTLERTVQLEPDDDSEKQISAKKRKTHRSNIPVECYRVRIRLPYWFCQTAWDISVSRAAGLWTTSLHEIFVLPPDHQVWTMCMQGDIAGINNLLESREIPLHAVTPWGGNLFWLAVTAGHTALARYLVTHGTATNVTLDCDGFLTNKFRELPLHEGLTMLQKHLEFAEEYGEIRGLWRGVLLTDLPPSGWSKERIIDVLDLSQLRFSEAAFGLLDSGSTVSAHRPPAYMRYPRLLRCLFRWMSREHCVPQDQKGLRILLDRLLFQVAEAYADPCLKRQAADKSSLRFDTIVLDELLWAGPPVAPISRAIERWVSALSHAGVDLCEYGAREVWAFQDHPSSEVLREERRFLNLTYGATPSDWRMWEIHSTDWLCGEFWDMLEHPERAMPGAYHDDAGYDRIVSPHEMNALRTLAWPPLGVKRKTLRRIGWALTHDEHSDLLTGLDASTFAELCTVIRKASRAWRHGMKTPEHHERLRTVEDMLRELDLQRPPRVGRLWTNTL